MTDFARNKKALHDFAIEETYETGIQLTGPEVKSVREGRANLKESYARVRDGELELDDSVLGIEFEGDEGLPLFLALADEAVDLLSVQQQLAVAGGELPFLSGVRVR